MIVNSQRNIDFLNKDILYSSIDEESLRSLWVVISEYVNGNADAVNDVNNSVLQLLDVTAKHSRDILNRLSVLSSGLADLYVIGGKSNTSLSIFDNGVKHISGDILVDSNLQTVSLGDRGTYLHAPQSIKTILKNGSHGNSTDYDIVKYSDVNNIIGTHSRLEIESIGSEMICSILVDLGESMPVSSVSFGLKNFGVSLPIVESIETSQDGLRFTQQEILLSGSNSIILEDYRFNNDIVVLSIRESRSRYIRINLIQKHPYSINGMSRYAVGINRLLISFNSTLTSGSIDIGPLRSSSPILKISIDALIDRLSIKDDNVRFHISHDANTWREIENSKVFNPDSSRIKVLNFNTKDIDSLATEDPVTNIYIRISMDSINATYLLDDVSRISRFRNLISSLDREIYTGSESGETDVFRSLGITYGGKQTFQQNADIDNDNLFSDIRVGDKTMVRSIGVLDVDNSINVLGNTISDISGESLTVFAKNNQMFVSIEDTISARTTSDFDPYRIEIFGLSKPLLVQANIVAKNEKFSTKEWTPVLPVLDPSGIYYVHFNKDVVEIDLSMGYFYSNSELIYLVDSQVTEARIYNEIGELHATVNVETIGNNNLINLSTGFEILYPQIPGMRFSNVYPLVHLSEDEFSVDFNRIVFGKNYSGQANIYRIVKNKIDSSPIKNIDGSIKMVLGSSKQIKTSYQLIGSDLKKVAKLRDTGIVKGTVSFDISAASVNSFIKEVGFVDGATEFSLTDTFSQVNNYNKNTIVLHSRFIDDGSIRFVGSTSPFRNRVYSIDELIDVGDWFIDMSGTPRIVLPELIYTSDIVDVEIHYSINANNMSSGGLYSINYDRGIIYTSAPIDQRIVISYQYSSVYSSYEAMTRIGNSDVTVGAGSISIGGDMEEGEYVAIIKSYSGEEVEYNLSPVITDLRINTITESDFI